MKPKRIRLPAHMRPTLAPRERDWVPNRIEYLRAKGREDLVESEGLLRLLEKHRKQLAAKWS
jgi:hypothetical protein